VIPGGIPFGVDSVYSLIRPVANVRYAAHFKVSTIASSELNTYP